jgi:hypothetical protein
MIEYFSRKNENSTGTPLPSNWIENISLLLNESYPEITNNDLTTQVWAEVFDTEILTIVSLLGNQQTPPTTFLISADIEKNSDKQLKKSLDKSIEIVGMMIEAYLHSLTHEQLYEYTHQWTEDKKSKFTFFYRTTREDISLTLKANKLLEE